MLWQASLGEGRATGLKFYLQLRRWRPIMKVFTNCVLTSVMGYNASYRRNHEGVLGGYF